MVEKRIEEAEMRKDPTLANYVAIMKKLVDTAKLNPKKLYLQIQSFSCHGYHVGGFQQVPTNYYDPQTKEYVMIPVEKLARECVTGVANVYVIILFACCREVKQISMFEVEKILQRQQE